MWPGWLEIQMSWTHLHKKAVYYEILFIVLKRCFTSSKPVEIMRLPLPNLITDLVVLTGCMLLIRNPIHMGCVRKANHVPICSLVPPVYGIILWNSQEKTFPSLYNKNSTVSIPVGNLIGNGVTPIVRLISTSTSKTRSCSVSLTKINMLRKFPFTDGTEKPSGGRTQTTVLSGETKILCWN